MLLKTCFCLSRRAALTYSLWSLLIECVVEAIVHCHTNLEKAILVGWNVYLLAVWQISLDAAILIKAEEFTDIAILAV